MNTKLITSISAIAATAIAISCMSSISTAEAFDETPATTTHLEVINPDVPESVTLCGKTIDLDRSDMWERMDRELTSMVYTHANTMLTIKRANKYFPVMAPILEKNGVPADLLYLACIESYLDPRAYSPAKAAGMWQFMPATAKEYGLEVGDEVDERYNLEKATAAAAKYLKRAYNKYGDWASVMAAYNGGMGRVSRELEAQMQDTAFDLYLTEETSRYPFRIMAMKEIMENPARYGFSIGAEHLYQPMEYTEEIVDSPVASWSQWALDHGISYAQLREANPWIRSKALTNKLKKTYTVKIPTSDSLSRSKQQKKVFNPAWTR